MWPWRGVNTCSRMFGFQSVNRQRSRLREAKGVDVERYEIGPWFNCMPPLKYSCDSMLYLEANRDNDQLSNACFDFE